MNLSRFIQLPFLSKKNRKQKAKYSQTPTPEEMLISKKAGKSYQGRKVAWNLTVRNMSSEINPNEVQVLTKFENKPGDIWLTVDLNKCPEILQCPSGKTISVEGEIESIQAQDIYLKNCHVKF